MLNIHSSPTLFLLTSISLRASFKHALSKHVELQHVLGQFLSFAAPGSSGGPFRPMSNYGGYPAVPTISAADQTNRQNSCHPSTFAWIAAAGSSADNISMRLGRDCHVFF